MSDRRMENILDYLGRQGVTYEPLKKEMLDHIVCDIENLVKAGYTYDDAWQKVLNEIPSTQLQSLQIETMETINKKESLSKWSAYLSFFLLFAGTAFKMLHLPGGGNLLIASLFAIIFSLLSGSIFGILGNKDKKGGWLLISIVLSIGLFLTSFAFQILHLPGATELRVLSVILLCLLYPTSYLYMKGEKGFLLPYLHQKYSPAIDRFILILFVVVVLLRVPSLLLGSQDLVSQILLVIVIASCGLQFFSATWHLGNEKMPAWSIGVLIVSFLCFLLPALAGVLPMPLRTVLLLIFFVTGAIIVAVRSEGGLKLPAMLSIVLVIAVHLAWSAVYLGYLPDGVNRIVFNAVTFILMIISMFPHRNDSLMKMYMGAAIAHYLFWYPWEIGLW